jgi:AraC-like DNA-binding protein
MDHGSGHMVHALEAGPFHVSVMTHSTGMRLGSHDHANACLHFVMQGLYTESTTGGAIAVPPGRALLKPPRLRHWNEFRTGARTLRLDFSPEACSDHTAFPDMPIVREDARVTRTCSSILEEIEEQDECCDLAVQGLCFEVLAHMLRSPRSRRRRAVRTSTMTQCEELLRDRYREPLSFTALSAELGVSRSHLATSFRRGYGCTLGEFVRGLRVEYVIDQLRSTRRLLSDIALAAGFSDQSHCTRVFRARTGCTPGEWRARFSC